MQFSLEHIFFISLRFQKIDFCILNFSIRETRFGDIVETTFVKKCLINFIFQMIIVYISTVH